MLLIVEKKTNSLLDMDSELDYMDNGYPKLVNRDIAFVADDVEVYTDVDMIENIVPGKYCYTSEQGFFENPDWQEPNPYGIPDELLEQIKNDTVEEIRQEVLNSAE